MHVKKSKKNDKINTNQIFYSSMTDPIALAVAFHGNLETKILKYLRSIWDLIFSKLNTKLNFLLVYDGSHSACGSISRES